MRGDNVTSGYYKPRRRGCGGQLGPPSEAAAFEDGWFHTGDIGELDATGRLLIKGRKKEMIVTPQGLNVFPEDVERALLAQPGVKDAGVVGLQRRGRRARSTRCSSLEPGADVDAIVRGANATLEDHQRVWSTSLWPGDGAAPHRRHAEAQATRAAALGGGRGGGRARRASARGTTVEDVVARFVAGRELTPETTLDELGLSSLDRVELMMALEEAFQTTLDESALAGATDDWRARGARVGAESVCAGCAAAVTSSAVPQPDVETSRGQSRSRSRPGTGRASRGSCGASACPPGFCRSRGSS